MLLRDWVLLSWVKSKGVKTDRPT